MKENLYISDKKLEMMRKRKLGVALDDFLLKEQRQAIHDNVDEMFRRKHKRMIKKKRGKDKDKQECGTTFIITTTTDVQGLCMVVSTSKERTKHTVSYKIHRKRQIMINDDDIDVYDGGDVYGVTVPVGESHKPAHSQAQDVLSLICHGVICLLTFIWDKLSKKELSKSCNYPVFLLSYTESVRYF